VTAVANPSGRDIVFEPNRRPWRRICLLDILWPNRAGERGTGFFVGPNMILSAGHCIFSHDNGGWADTITATPACDGDAQPYESHLAADMHTVNGWTQDRSDDFDYGAVVLADPIGSKVGWFSLAAYADMDLAVTMLLAGYPVDVHQQRTMWSREIAIHPGSAFRVQYSAATSNGESGAPVFVKAPEGNALDAGPVVALHTDGRPGQSSGTRVTEDMIKNVETWGR